MSDIDAETLGYLVRLLEDMRRNTHNRPCLDDRQIDALLAAIRPSPDTNGPKAARIAASARLQRRIAVARCGCIEGQTCARCRDDSQ